jgi:hypothetical protein
VILMAPVGYPFEGRPPFIFRLLANPVAGPVLIRLTPRAEVEKRARAVYGDPTKLDPGGRSGRQYELFPGAPASATR